MKISIDKILKIIVMILLTIVAFKLAFSKQIIYAIIAGIYAFMVVGAGTSPVGMIYVIIISNVFNLLIRMIEEKRMDYLMHKMTKMSPIDKELLNAGN